MNTLLHRNYRNIFSFVLLYFFCITKLLGQSQYQVYSYQFDQKLNAVLYSTATAAHTSLKPLFIDDSLLKVRYQAIMNPDSVHTAHGFMDKRFFNQHLIDFKSATSTFYADILPDISIARDLTSKQNNRAATLGLQLGGTYGRKLFYYLSVYQTQATFPDYISTYIGQVGVVPGQASVSNNGNRSYNWTYLTALVSYTPFQFLNITAGRDKTFIGDGYRSMLLSDFASPYPFLKLTGNLGPFKYMAMWSYMNDPAATSQYGIDRKKFGVFHYLDWNISKRLSFGFFENVTGFFTDDNGVKRPFDFNYINPLIYLKPINNASEDPDKSLLGFTGKFKISDWITVYGQFALNEFHSKAFFSNSGSVYNKYGWQLGLRGANLFAVKNLNFLVETNTAKPYTYQARSAIENYSDNGEPLAHPWGANFREFVGLLNYSINRFDFSAEADLGRYGLDINGVNYGKNIFQVYTSAPNVYGNYTTQGLLTNMEYFEGKIAFLLNYKTNLRIELGGIYRTESNSHFNDKTTLLTFGLRSSFRNFYRDLSSYKTHQ